MSRGNDYGEVIMQTPEWQTWVKQGRGWLGKTNTTAEVAAQVALFRKEDKQIAQYYELATGQKAGADVIEKYAQYAADPALLSAAIQKDTAKAPETGQYKDTIAANIQEKLGRPPTAAELGYFGKAMESGQLDAYGLDTFLHGTSEFQSKASDTARTKLAAELGGYDTQYLNKIQQGLESKYAAAGRPGASAFGSALIGAGKDLASERTGYLAGLGYQDFQRGQDTLTGAYQNRLAQMYANQQNQAALGSESRQRYYSQMDYSRQQAAAERLARLSQPKQQSFLQSIVPGLIQGGLTIGGGLIGGPIGAGVGAGLGQQYARQGRPAGGRNNLVMDYSRPGAWNVPGGLNY